MKILNLGCGSRASAAPNVVNIDWSIMLRLKTNPLLRLTVPLVLRGNRLERFRALPDNIMVHNLAKNIPFPDQSVDAVYHSHVLEHLDRDVAPLFMQEIKRVLKPGGILRIVVPDLEYFTRAYLEHLDVCEKSPAEMALHDNHIAPFLEQCVRREATGTQQQKPLRRLIENLLLGDARQRGDTHQWMYDRVNLQALLEKTGYHSIVCEAWNSSSIPDWASYGLDAKTTGGEYLPHSLYVEARA